MGVISGLLGIVDVGTNIPHTVGEWSVTHSADVQEYSASNTKSGKARVTGNRDWSGQYRAYGHTPAVMPGSTFTFVGSFTSARTTGATGEAMCEQVEITWDIEAGTIIQHTCSFASNGALTIGTVSDPGLDTVVPDEVPSSIATKVQIAPVATSPSFVELPDVRTITLTISRANASYVSSSTAGETKRVAGVWDFVCAISIYTDDAGVAAVPDVNDSLQVRLFVDATTHWDLRWMKFSELSDYQIDIETGALVSATVNCAMSGFEDIGGVGTEGAMKDPAGATVWP